MFKALKAFKEHVPEDGPRAADGAGPRARHPLLWFVTLYGGGVLVTTVVATIFHVLVFAASK